MNIIELNNLPNVEILNSPVINNAVPLMRPEYGANQEKFQKIWMNVAKELFKPMLKKANKNGKRTIIMPVMRAAVPIIPEKVNRSGIPISYVWTKRNKKHVAKILTGNFPRVIPDGWEIELFDPAIASGTSLQHIIDILLGKNGKKICKWQGEPVIRVTSGVASKDGLLYLANLFPEVEFTIGRSGNDMGLDGNKYVMYTEGPYINELVAGDVGDRLTGMTGNGKVLMMAKIKRGE